VPEDPPTLPPGRYVWRSDDAPSARGLSPEEARAEQLEQLRTLRDGATDPAKRAEAAAMIEALGGEPRLHVVEDDDPDRS
jgi:hypothetical protein